MVYFTADLHLYHDNIIKHVNRPFHNVTDMNKTIINNWNNRVSFDDDIYILGDFTMKGPDLVMEALSQLKGRKYLIHGNHDRFVDNPTFDNSLFIWIKDYAEIIYENTRFILFHYPIMEWNGFYKGSIQLHGHQHNHEDYNFYNLQHNIRRFDVGVDANYMTPVSAKELVEFFGLK